MGTEKVCNHARASMNAAYTYRRASPLARLALCTGWPSQAVQSLQADQGFARMCRARAVPSSSPAQPAAYHSSEAGLLVKPACPVEPHRWRK